MFVSDYSWFNYILLPLEMIIIPLQGFYIFIIYCLNEKVRDSYREFFSLCFPCCRVPLLKSGPTFTDSLKQDSGFNYSSKAIKSEINKINVETI